MIPTFAPYDVKRWVEENKHLYNPPYKTNRVVVDQKEFIVMIVHGPNTRLDFHIEPADEFFTKSMEISNCTSSRKSVGAKWSRSAREKCSCVRVTWRTRLDGQRTPGAW